MYIFLCRITQQNCLLRDFILFIFYCSFYYFFLYFIKMTESQIKFSVNTSNRPLFGMTSFLLTRNSQRQSYKMFLSHLCFSLTLFAVSYRGPKVLLQAQLSCNRVRQHPRPQLDAERCYYTKTGHEVLWRLRRQLLCQKRWHLRNGTPDFEFAASVSS